jgi:4-diphosphocytidyl-2-C-methyl-D-erythritol kinase
MSPPPGVAAGLGSATRTVAPAKVNLGLRITGRRAGGYHELRSVFLRLELADEVTLADTPGARDTLAVEGDPACPVDDNLVLRATRAYRAAALAGGTAVASVAIRLRKRVPMEAGLAGGSSDAAAVLRLLAHRYPDAVHGRALASVGQGVGSDVPFFVAAAGAALVSDAGIEVEPLPPPIEPLGVLLVTPAIRLATGWVFAAWDGLHANGTVTPGDTAVLERLAAELRAGATPATILGLAPELRDANDLWPAAVSVEPGLEELRDILERRLGWPVLMTGSGSTLLALTTKPEEAVAAAERLRADPPDGLERARIEASASGSPYPPEVVTDRGAGA